MLIGGSIQPYRLYSMRSGRQIAAPTVSLVSGTIQTTRGVFGTWRAANSRPYGVVPFCPHGLYLQRPRNGTQAVPYGFAERSIFSTVVVQKRPFFCPLEQTEPPSISQNCQLSIVNFKTPASGKTGGGGLPMGCYFSFRFFSTTVAPRPMAAAIRMPMAASSLTWSPVRGLPVMETARFQRA